MRMLRNRNVLAVLAILLLTAVVAVIGLTVRAPRTVSDETLPGVQASDGAAGEPLYLLVTAGSTTYAPIRLDSEEIFTLTQGEDRVNVIHALPDRIWMESSTCENQDCVEQGEVTADNRGSRVLGNMIICLPNLVQLELFTADELREIGIPVARDEAPVSAEP